MPVDERSRHEMYSRLEAVLGREHAMTLMEHLPPVGWADVATKQDIARLEHDIDALEGRLSERLDLRVDGLKHELLAAFRGELNAAITAQTRAMIFAMVGSVTASTSLIFAAIRFG